MIKTIALLLLAVVCLCVHRPVLARAEASLDPYANETPEERDARMAWWREARFGLFIHWGVYAVPAGTYKDEKVSGVGEWIMLKARIPVDEYRAFAQDFNPVKYDPDEWVRLAKEAGMKYIVITSKHHDGFALFDSKVTDWDIMDSSPYGKDLLRPLEAACKKHGMRLGFYYSQAQDWTHPGGAKSGLEEGDGWDEAHKGSFDDYLKEIAYPQVEEILTGYDIDVLWWDTPRWMNTERADLLLPLLKLPPGILTNNRLGGGYPGDFSTPEQHIPATGLDYDWETCMTMNDTWGYKSYDDNWKSTETLIRNLIDIASKGGNYLLNVGPTAEGLIPEASVQRLKEIGAWMKVNGTSIYGTTASPFSNLTWGRCTKKVDDHRATLYLHVFDWPTDGRLLVPGLKNTPATATLLATGASIESEPVEDGLLITVPSESPDPISSVIALTIDGGLQVEKPRIRPDANGALAMDLALVEFHVPERGTSPEVESRYGDANVGFWTDAGAWLSWPFQTDQGGKYQLTAQVATSSSGAQIEISCGDAKINAEIPNTGGYDKFQDIELGTIPIEPGEGELNIRPVPEDWKPFNLRAVTLTPVR